MTIPKILHPYMNVKCVILHRIDGEKIIESQVRGSGLAGVIQEISD